MKNIKQTAIRFCGIAAGSALILTSHVYAFAAGGAQSFNKDNSQIHVDGSSDFSTKPTATSIKDFIANFGSQILDTALLLVAIVAVLFLVFYGFQYITAGGDPEKAKKARAGIINAIIGIIVVSLAFTIVHFAINASSPVEKVLNSNGTANNGF